MKKRMIAVLLAAMLLLAGTAGLCEDEAIRFAPNLADAFMKQTSGAWMENSYLRAGLTVMLAMDMTLAGCDENKLPNMNESSYIGMGDGLISVIYKAQNVPGEYIYVCYNGDGLANYVYLHNLNDSGIPMLMSGACADGYFKNSDADIYRVAMEFGNALKSGS